MSVAIRQATADDLTVIKNCAVAAYTKYIDSIGREPAPMVADFAKLIDAKQVSVACSDNEVIGFVVFYLVQNTMHLENVAVFPKFIGQGIGRQLIEHVEKAAKKANVASVSLYTNEAMTDNLSLYPVLGYLEYERKTEAGFDRVYFRKRLLD